MNENLTLFEKALETEIFFERECNKNPLDSDRFFSSVLLMVELAVVEKLNDLINN